MPLTTLPFRLYVIVNHLFIMCCKNRLFHTEIFLSQSVHTFKDILPAIKSRNKSVFFRIQAELDSRLVRLRRRLVLRVVHTLQVTLGKQRSLTRSLIASHALISLTLITFNSRHQLARLQSPYKPRRRLKFLSRVSMQSIQSAILL